MARTSPDGTRHPTGTDPYDPGHDGDHVSKCPECLAQDWGPRVAEAWSWLEAERAIGRPV